jgi:hypothetical protein
MHLLLIFSTFAAAPPPATASPEAADTAIVCPAEFLPALRPWLVHRAAQGHRFALIANEQSPEAILPAIREAATGGRLRYVLLVGDDEPASQSDPRIRDRCVPSFRAPAKVNIRWGGEPWIATDNPYGDLDADGSPDLAVGRLPADSSRELGIIVDKILRYERDSSYGTWRRNVNFVAGVGGFGMIADALIEMTAKRLITDGVPAGFTTSMTYGSWRSPYCPDPRSFRRAAMDRLNEGALFWVYIGHGARTYLDWIQVPGNTYPILDTRDVAHLDCRDGLPIAVMLSCHTAAFDKGEDCLAEEMLRSPGAPVAIVGGTRVTMPYAMSVLATAMLDEYFVRRRATLGEVFLAAKLQMLADEQDDPQRKSLDAIAAAVSPAPKDLFGERAEHILLFHLIGDPLLKLQHPEKVDVDVARFVETGDRAHVTITSPIAGKCHVELVCRRDRTTFRPPSRLSFDPSDEVLAGYNDIYERANDHRYVAETFAIEPGTFRVQIHVGDNSLGPCHVRVFVEGRDQHALGAADVYVRRKKHVETQEQGSGN